MLNTIEAINAMAAKYQFAAVKKFWITVNWVAFTVVLF